MVAVKRIEQAVDSHLFCWNKASEYPGDAPFYCQKTFRVQTARVIDVAIDDVGVLDERVRVVLVPDGQRDEFPGIQVCALLNFARGHDQRCLTLAESSNIKRAARARN
jgi:hypothetical protein